MMSISWNYEMIEAGAERANQRGEFVESARRGAESNSLGWTGATEGAIRDLESEIFLPELLSNPSGKVFGTRTDILVLDLIW